MLGQIGGVLLPENRIKFKPVYQDDRKQINTLSIKNVYELIFYYLAAFRLQHCQIQWAGAGCGRCLPLLTRQQTKHDVAAPFGAIGCQTLPGLAHRGRRASNRRATHRTFVALSKMRLLLILPIRPHRPFLEAALCYHIIAIFELTTPSLG